MAWLAFVYLMVIPARIAVGEDADGDDPPPIETQIILAVAGFTFGDSLEFALSLTAAFDLPLFQLF